MVKEKKGGEEAGPHLRRCTCLLAASCPVQTLGEEDAEPEETTVGDGGQVTPGDPARTPTPALLLRLGGCLLCAPQQQQTLVLPVGAVKPQLCRGILVPEPAWHQLLPTKNSHSVPPEEQRVTQR